MLAMQRMIMMIIIKICIIVTMLFMIIIIIMTMILIILIMTMMTIVIIMKMMTIICASYGMRLCSIAVTIYSVHSNTLSEACFLSVLCNPSVHQWHAICL